MSSPDETFKKTLIQTHLIVDAGDFERFSYDESAQSLTEAVLADRTQLRDIALIKTTIIATPVDWKFIASRQLPQAVMGWSHDRTDLRDIDPLSTSGSALYISADIAQGNSAEVTDITNQELGGLGLNSWLVDQALQAFLQVSGPDPWIKGGLSPVDNENENRVPFWQRHVGQPITVNGEGGGHFCAPWIHGFNPYRMKVKPILIYQDGKLPRRIDNPGLTLCDINGRLACRAHKGFVEIG
jgi:hypothetical protein